MSANYNNQYIPELEELYPEIYQELYPFIIDGINELRRRGEGITPESINRMVDDIIIRSGLWDEDEAALSNNFDDQFNEAEFVMARPGANRPNNRPPNRPNNRPNHRPGCPRRGCHNRNSLRDLIKILTIRELIR